MKKDLSIFVLIGCLLFSCTEPIDLKFAQSIDKTLVVDGFISDSLRRHQVRLSYTSGFDSRGFFIPDPVVDANIIILDDLGNEINLESDNNGSYHTPVTKAEEGRQYRIRIIINEEIFESEFQGLPSGGGDLTLKYTPERREQLSGQGVIREFNGVRIDATLKNVESGSYFLWELEHHFIGEAFNSNQYCHVRAFDTPRIHTFDAPETTIASETELITELEFIEPSYQFKHDYAVVGKQYITSAIAYGYWRRIREQTENVGSLFDTAPARILGNVKNTRLDAATLGFFGVYKETVNRVFFNQNELPFPIVDYECGGSPPPEFCSDCLKHPGQQTLPLYVEERLWWRCIFIGLDDFVTDPPSTQTLDQCN